MKQKLRIIGLVFVILYGCGHSCMAQQKEQLAIQYFKNQEFEKAALLFAELFQQKPDNYYYSYYLPCLLELNNYKEAEKVVVRQIRRYPNMQRYAVDLGHVYEREGNAAKAAKQYDRCISECMDSPQALRELSMAFLNYRQFDHAIRCYGKIRSINGDPSAYAMEMVMLYKQNGNYENALKELMLWTNTHFSFPEIEEVETELNTWIAEDEDQQKKELIGKTLIQYANKYPDHIGYAHLMLWFSLQENDYPAALQQAVAIDRRFQGDGRKEYEVASIAEKNKDYATAIRGYNHIRKTYSEFSPCYEAALSGSIHARYQQLLETYPPEVSGIRALKTELDSFFSQHPLRDDNLKTYLSLVEIEAMYLDHKDRAVALLENALQEKLSTKGKAVCKLQLGDIHHLSDEVWEATLLYSQVEKDFPNDTLGQNAKFKNAKLAFYMGEFEWARAQLDVLRAATSKMIANDAMQLSLLIADNEGEDSLNLPLMHYAKADYYFDCHEYQKALLSIDSMDFNENSSLEDDALLLKAKIFIRQQKYTEATQLLEHIYRQFPEDILCDDALFLHAQLMETRLNDPLTAMDLYQKLLKEHPDSLHAPEARRNFRMLRNAKL